MPVFASTLTVFGLPSVLCGSNAMLHTNGSIEEDAAADFGMYVTKPMAYGIAAVFFLLAAKALL